MSGLNSETLNIAKTFKLFIGGDFPRTESGRVFPVLRKKSKKIYANICLASRKDLRNAVTAAQGALSSWSSKTAYNRAQILYRMAEMTESKRQEISEILEQTLGLSRTQSKKSIDDGIAAFVYFAGWADKYPQVVGSTNPVSGPHHNFTSPEPVGVVGLLAEEKFNFAHLCADIASVVSSGNTVIALLAEEGAAIIGPLSEIFATSDLTKGAINLLTGSTKELYQQFGLHMEIQALSVQCKNSEILSKLKELGAENMKRVVGPQSDKLSLEALSSFVEFKTIWHPIGY